MAVDRKKGWLALSPLLVFLLIYVVTSLVARDFYKVPVAAAFIIASAYALLITRSVPKTDDKMTIFSRGAGNKNVLLMIWSFVLAGAFAATAKDIGAIDATVNATLHHAFTPVSAAPEGSMRIHLPPTLA